MRRTSEALILALFAFIALDGADVVTSVDERLFLMLFLSALLCSGDNDLDGKLMRHKRLIRRMNVQVAIETRSCTLFL
jgi:hypothetical protein